MREVPKPDRGSVQRRQQLLEPAKNSNHYNNLKAMKHLIYKPGDFPDMCS